MMNSNPWAILLCKFRDRDDEPYDRDTFERLFTVRGVGEFGMVDYFAEMSHGAVDVSGSRVFGWLTLNRDFADYVGSGVNQQGRADLITWARSAAAVVGIDLTSFFNVVVVTNVSVDLFGGGAGVVTGDGRAMNGMTGLSPSLLGQEMIHGFGLSEHSRLDGSSADYMDSWDVMSTAGAFMTPHPVFNNRDVRGNPVFLIGPGLNAANMDALGWLDPTRVWTNSERGYDRVVRLRPLHRRDLDGFLAASFGDYFVEFRVPQRWDAGIPQAALFVHRLEGRQSYLMSSNRGGQSLVKGDSFGDATPSDPVLSMFTSFARLEVIEIDESQLYADVRLTSRPRFQEPSLGTGFSIGGIERGGGGIVIFPGGGVRPVPPRSPLTAVLERFGHYLNADLARSGLLRNAMRREALEDIAAIVERELRSVQGFQEPKTSGLDVCQSDEHSALLG